jgi:hypothetical protein
VSQPNFNRNTFPRYRHAKAKLLPLSLTLLTSSYGLMSRGCEQGLLSGLHEREVEPLGAGKWLSWDPMERPVSPFNGRLKVIAEG